QSLLFFFYVTRDPRDLHSFPTRRSSDLAAQARKPRQHRSRAVDKIVEDQRGVARAGERHDNMCADIAGAAGDQDGGLPPVKCREDRKSTRLNSSHVEISYAVFCLKKKNI